MDWLAERSRSHFLSQIQTDVELSNPDPEMVTNWSPAIPPEIQGQSFNAFHLIHPSNYEHIAAIDPKKTKK